MDATSLLFASLISIANAEAVSTVDQQVIQAISQAVEANQKAASVGGEWRDAGKLIADAQAAANGGDKARALRLAAKAREQGKLGYEQAKSQRKVSQPSYLK